MVGQVRPDEFRVSQQREPAGHIHSHGRLPSGQRSTRLWLGSGLVHLPERTSQSQRCGCAGGQDVNVELVALRIRHAAPSEPPKLAGLARLKPAPAKLLDLCRGLVQIIGHRVEVQPVLPALASFTRWKPIVRPSSVVVRTTVIGLVLARRLAAGNGRPLLAWMAGQGTRGLRS